MALIPLETYLASQSQQRGAVATGPGVPPPRPPIPLETYFAQQRGATGPGVPRPPAPPPPPSAGADPQTLANLNTISATSRLLGTGINMFRLSPTVSGALGVAGSLTGGVARALSSRNNLERGLNAAGGLVGAAAGAGRIPAIAEAVPSLAGFSSIPGISYAGDVLGFGADLAGGKDPSKAAAKLAIKAGLTYAAGSFAPVIGTMFAPAIDNLVQQIFGGKTIHDFNREMAKKEQENISGSVRETLKGASPDTLEDILASNTGAGFKGSPAFIGNAIGLFAGSNSPGGNFYDPEERHPGRPFSHTLAALSEVMPQLGYTTTDYSKEPTGKFTGGIGFASGSAYDEWLGYAEQVAAQVKERHPEMWARAMVKASELGRRDEAGRAAWAADTPRRELAQAYARGDIQSGSGDGGDGGGGDGGGGDGGDGDGGGDF